MKLTGAGALRYFAQPDPSKAGVLIYSADAMRAALRRQEVLAALLGPKAEEEMRLTRLAGGDLRKDPALLTDALRASGFFPGTRAVFVEEAGDALAPTLTAALEGWRESDARLVVTAGALGAKSPLRLAFESDPRLIAIGLYDDPPSREELLALVAAAGLATPTGPALEALIALSRELDPGDLRQTLEKIALYKTGDPSPLTPEEIAALAPATREAEAEAALMAAAEGREGELIALLRRLAAQGTGDVALCIAALRYFRTLHAAAVAPESLARARGLSFAAREAMARQARAWGALRLEEALRHLVETDLTLRSTSRAPGFALVERTLLRLSRLSQSR